MVLSSRPSRSSGACLTKNHKSLSNGQRASPTLKTSSIRVTRSINPTGSASNTSPHKIKCFDSDRSSRPSRKRRLLETDGNSPPSAQQPHYSINGRQSRQVGATENKANSSDCAIHRKASYVDNASENFSQDGSLLLNKSQQTHDKRTLRSRDERIKPKSDLAIYFPNYEEIIKDAPNDDRK